MTPETLPITRLRDPRAGASTEPGPDDPGDCEQGGAVHELAQLQRSRGQMTPETDQASRHDRRVG